MIEIRTIQQSEAVTFLRLICDAFGVDFARARPVFFSEPMFDLRRKWALWEDGEMKSILTTVPLEFGWGPAWGIAGVATREADRRRGLAEQLIRAVIQVANGQNQGPPLLFARDPRLYSRLGFEVLDETISFPLPGSAAEPNLCEIDQVVQVYDAWALGDPARLRRNEARWKLWKWNLRLTAAAGAGYTCMEYETVREAVQAGPPEGWCAPAGTKFLGLRSLAQEIGLEVADRPAEAWLMGLDVPHPVRFFLTDQF